MLNPAETNLNAVLQPTVPSWLTSIRLTSDDCALMQVALDVLVNKFATRQKAAHRRSDEVTERKLIQYADTISELRQKLVRIQAEVLSEQQIQSIIDWRDEVADA